MNEQIRRDAARLESLGVERQEAAYRALQNYILLTEQNYHKPQPTGGITPPKIDTDPSPNRPSGGYSSGYTKAERPVGIVNWAVTVLVILGLISVSAFYRTGTPVLPDHTRTVSESSDHHQAVKPAVQHPVQRKALAKAKEPILRTLGGYGAPRGVSGPKHAATSVH